MKNSRIENAPGLGLAPETQSCLLRLSFACLVGLIFLLLPHAAAAATITVTTTADDLTPNDGTVSLREAITAINAGSNLGDPDISAQSPGTFGVNDTIIFNISGSGVKTINVGGNGLGALPAITKPLTINGYMQPGASANALANGDNAVILIELNGADAGANADGLALASGSAGSTIKGLAINRFSANGINVLSNGNLIVGNFVGTNPAGDAAEPNQSDGIRISNSSNNAVGGTTPDARNVVSGNQLDGIHVVGTLVSPATGNIIAGNFVGTNAAGTGSVGNKPGGSFVGTPEGNSMFGIEISGGNLNTVGGTTAGARNVVSLNLVGIGIDNGAQQNIIEGNFSGVGADGVSPVGNNMQGIVMRSDDSAAPPFGPGQPNEPGTSFNTIGGTTAGAGNLVEFNGTAGVAVFANPVATSGQPNIGNKIEGNSIFENGLSNPSSEIGIDLTNGFVFPKDDGFTPNDSKGHGASNDPNNFQNFPVLTSVVMSGGSTTINGSLTQTVSPNTTFRVEFFASHPDPAGGQAEGETFIGSANVTTNGSGTVSFSPTFNVTLTATQTVTATATDPTGNTSEFSAGVPAVPPTPPVLSINDVTQFADPVGTTNFVFTVTRSGDLSASSTVQFATADGTATLAENDYVANSGTLTFGVGDSAKTVTVQVTGNSAFEPDETFFVNLSSPTGATISKAQGVGTIQSRAFSINDVTVTEPSGGGSVNATFTVTLSAASTQTVTVDYATADGTATAPADYQSVFGTLVFPPGVTTRTINVTVNGDTAPESDETHFSENFFVNLSNANGATVSKAQGLGTINKGNATSVFQFSSPTASVNENASPDSVNLTVTRTGDTSAAASVHFETSDGTASQKNKYTFGSGTLQWAAGDSTPKTITVLLTNEAFVEGNKTFTVTLSNPSPTSAIGNPDTATVTIVDDDTAPTSVNPIDNAQFFVRQHYLDFLGREADTSGLNFWTSQITACGTNQACVSSARINVSAAFFLSIEFQETSGFVIRTQRAAFGRQSADPTTRVPYLQFMRDTRQVGAGVVVGQAGFDTLLESNKQSYATQLVNDPAFLARYPIQPAASFVDSLFASAAVTPTSAERTAAINAFGPGGIAGRVAALRSVADSNSLRQAELNPSFVLAEYYGYLRRNPTDAPDFSDAGYQFWLAKLNQFNGDFNKAEMVKAFITSTEYRGRFGQP
jgi:CSLREA domain-containing protein